MAKRKAAKKAPKKTSRTSKKKSAKKGVAAQIMAWEDDPLSGRQPIKRTVPDPNVALKFKIKGAVIPPGIYAQGTKEFRYWTAAESLRRCSDYWTPLVSVSKWQTGPTLPVSLDKGVDLNAYYDRTELAFFHGNAKDGTTVYSGEAHDIVAHEMGHAILDAVRPQLFDAPFIETGSLHEFWGDASAILSAFQLSSVVSDATADLKANRSSFVSRCAEQLGWAIRTLAPTAVDPDSLRNACNKFKYVDPDTLPNSAPASQLCAEVHSFSRVFSGAFYEILGGMAKISSVGAAAQDMGKLLLAAVAAAPIDPSYYAQVAAHMIDADTSLFSGKYRTPLTDVFVARKILSAQTVRLTKSMKRARGMVDFAMQPAVATATHDVELSAKKFGLTGKIVVSAPVERKPFTMAAASVTQEIAAAQDTIDTAAQRFVEMLFAHDRVAVPAKRSTRNRSMAAAGTPRRGKGRDTSDLTTHKLVKSKGGHKLERVRFLCGCSRGGSAT